jgi:hypothetical protein
VNQEKKRKKNRKEKGNGAIRGKYRRSAFTTRQASQRARTPHGRTAITHRRPRSALPLSQSLSPAALTHHQLHSKVPQYAVLTSLWSEEGGRSTSGTMGIPLGLVLLPLLLLNVADAPHEEAPAANQDLPTGFHLPIGSCPGEHNRLLTTLLSPHPDPELAVPSSSPSSLLGLHMVHPSRYPSIIV